MVSNISRKSRKERRESMQVPGSDPSILNIPKSSKDAYARIKTTVIAHKKVSIQVANISE